jgi:Arc-like DNA binding domain
MADTTEMKIRIPAGTHERLRLAAERDHRSMSAQTLSYIERCLDADDKSTRPRPRKDHGGIQEH